MDNKLTAQMALHAGFFDFAMPPEISEVFVRFAALAQHEWQSLKEENERLTIALDCDRAILKSRTESMNRFMAERDALKAKLEARENP